MSYGDPPPAALRGVRTLFDAGAAGGATDGQLLERFRSRGDHGPAAESAEAAFAVLVARHGPMVLGVCRRALRDPDDVADAFQATFLVLVRKAGSVRAGDSLGRWLYGVSRRVAARARCESARRAAREGRGLRTEDEPTAPADDADRRELLAALDDEVARLPGPFREAVRLCDLGGLTHEAAARQLGCPVGTVESRLSRGRKRLRERLTRCGFAPQAVAPALKLGLGLPAVPDALSASTLKAASGSGSVPGAVRALVQGVITDMAWIQLKAVAAGVATAALACGLGVTTAARLKADDPPKPESKPETTAVAVPLKPKVLEPGDRLRIEVLEALPGRPISGERLVRPDGTVSLGFYGDVDVAGLTRREVKEKVTLHLRKYLPDKTLGLVEFDPETGKTRNIPAQESDSVFVDESPTYLAKTTPFTRKSATDTIRPGDFLIVDVLEALPGRPISGERLVLPEGVISLGFYGDVKVSGLTRREAKAQVVKHLSKFLPDDVLGLVEETETGKEIKIDPADSNRVYVDDSPSFEKRPVNFPTQASPTRVQPGDQILVEVLRALPGRPISGERLVRPDGTISLDFYGDVAVAGLTRREIKTKIVEHLRKYLPDEVLVTEIDPKTKKRIDVAPADSHQVFVDDDLKYWPKSTYKEQAGGKRARPDEKWEEFERLRQRVNALAKEVEALKKRGGN